MGMVEGKGGWRRGKNIRRDEEMMEAGAVGWGDALRTSRVRFWEGKKKRRGGRRERAE